MGLLSRSASEGVRPAKSYLTCLACGIDTLASADRTEDMEVLPFSKAGPSDVYTITVTRCDQCQSILNAADDLLTAMPDLRMRIGAREIARHRLSAALYALDAFGVNEASVIDRLTASPRDLRLLMGSMTSVGVATLWVRRYSPFGMPASKQAQGDRWGHVGRAARQELRDAYCGLLALRIDVPVPIAPPEGYRACIFCGVGTYRARRRDADSLWTEQSASARSLGGAPSSERIHGVTCPPCSDAILAVGAIGNAALSRALVRHLGVEKMNLGALQIEFLQGWAVRAAGAAPNETAWGHLDLSQLRAELRI